MSKIFTFNDVEINNNYGNLEFEASGIAVDDRFDAYNSSGSLKTFGNKEIADFEVTYAILHLTNTFGDVIESRPLNESQIRSYLELHSEYIIERLAS